MNNASRGTIRAIAGGYLIYLAYELITGGAVGENEGYKKIIMIAGIAAFIGFGAYFIYSGVKSYLKATKASPASDEETTEEDTESIPDNLELPEEETESDETGENTQSPDQQENSEI